jgi:hypothetical protein
MFYFLKLESTAFTSYIIAYQYTSYFILREQQYKTSKDLTKAFPTFSELTASSSQVYTIANDQTLTATSTDAIQIITYLLPTPVNLI